MRVTVMMLGSRVPNHFFHRHNASLKLTTADVFKLNRRMTDMKMITEYVVQLGEDAGTLRWWNIVDGHMAGQGAGV